MNRIFASLTLFIATISVVGSLAVSPVGAIDITETGNQPDANKALTNEKNVEDTVPVVIGRVISTILFLLGIFAVLVIIMAGFRYVTANGDAGQVKTARNAILYACVGLIVAILSYGIVGFVLSNITGGTNP